MPTTGRHVTRALLLAALLIPVASCAPAASTAPLAIPTRTAPVCPGAEWERIMVAEDVGWSSAGLDSVRAALAALSSTGFMAVVGGRVLLEYGDVDSLRYLASVRKSVLPMLFGNYVASGRIRLGRTLPQLGIDDIGGLTDAERRATVRHLLSARSGVFHPASNSGDDLPLPHRAARSRRAVTTSTATGTSTRCLSRRPAANIYDALETDLARPLGMQDWRRELQRRTGDTTRSVHRAYHMHLSTRDMAHIGYHAARGQLEREAAGASRLGAREHARGDTGNGDEPGATSQRTVRLRLLAAV